MYGYEIGLKKSVGGQEHLWEYLAMVALELSYTANQTLMIYKLGFNQNYHMFDSMLLLKIVLCSKFH